MANTTHGRTVGTLVAKKLKGGSAPWTITWRAGAERELPYNAATGAPYRAVNSLYLHAVANEQGYSDNRWMTYAQAQQLGGQVRQGERATTIQFWQWHSRVPVADAAGRQDRDEHAEPRFQLIRHDRPTLFNAAVFNADQVDGLPHPEPRPAPAPADRHQRAEMILTASRAEIRELQGDIANYDVVADRITLPHRGQFSGVAGSDMFYSTALHQLAHWTGHPDRLDRDIAHPNGTAQYAAEELSAEITSLMLADELGIGHDPSRHVGYIGTWIALLERDPTELVRAAAAAERTTAYVLGLETERQLEPPPSPSKHQAPSPAPQPAGDPPTDNRRYLAVPFREKDQARQAGARWDKNVKAWWIRDDIDSGPFSRWLDSPRQVTSAKGADPLTGFAEVLARAGLSLPGAPIMDGTIQRVPVEGDKAGQRSGAYVGYLDGRPAGVIQNFKAGTKVTWVADLDMPLDAAASARLATDATARRQSRDAALQQTHKETAAKLVSIWEAAEPAQAHPYLARKTVEAHGARTVTPAALAAANAAFPSVNGRPGHHYTLGKLLIPIRDQTGEVINLQAIRDDGWKGFAKDAQLAGGSFTIGNPAQRGPVVVAEGFATGATIHRLTEYPVAVAFNAGNLLPVAQQLRTRFPDRAIIIAGDNDEALTQKIRQDGTPHPNVGVEKATAAALAVGGIAVIPPAGPNATSADWNDHAAAAGDDQARRDFRARQRLADVELRVQREIERELEANDLGETTHDATHDATRDFIEAEAQDDGSARAEQEASRDAELEVD